MTKKNGQRGEISCWAGEEESKIKTCRGPIQHGPVNNRMDQGTTPYRKTWGGQGGEENGTGIADEDAAGGMTEEQRKQGSPPLGPSGVWYRREENISAGQAAGPRHYKNPPSSRPFPRFLLFVLVRLQPSILQVDSLPLIGLLFFSFIINCSLFRSCALLIFYTSVAGQRLISPSSARLFTCCSNAVERLQPHTRRAQSRFNPSV